MSTTTQEKKLKTAIWIITGAVLILVGLMRRVKIPLPEGMDFTFLPPFYSTLNALAAVALLASLYFVKRKNIAAHRKANFTALGISTLFLLCYVVYHFTTPETKFGDANGDMVIDAAEAAAVAATRPYYLALLISHIFLAAASFPFILFTFLRAHLEQWDRHRKLAKWVWPIWFYVCVTGPVCYLMLRPFYQ